MILFHYLYKRTMNIGVYKVAFETLYITKVLKVMLDPMLSYTAVTSPENNECASTATL
jgi:hypothetical protein